MKKVLIRIDSRGLGDTLCSIPTIKKLYKTYDSLISVQTYIPDVFKNNPIIREVFEFDKELDFSSYIIHDTFNWVGKKMEGGIEYKHNLIDIRQFHALHLGFQLLPEEMSYDFYADEYKLISNLPEKYVVVHPVATWPSRSWDEKKWQNLIENLEEDIPVVAVGKESNEFGFWGEQKKPTFDIEINNGLDLMGKTNLSQLWHVLNKADSVITMDSGILHLAGTTDTNIIQLGSSINPKFRAPYRNGTQDYKYSYILGECDKFCASDMKNGLKEWEDIHGVPPIMDCLEGYESFKCHPSVKQVIDKCLNEKFYNIEEQKKWNNLDMWENDGEEWSEGLGGTDKIWDTYIFDDIKSFLSGSVLEIASGYGRMTDKLLQYDITLTGVDLNENCISRCKERFENYENASFFKNDGKSLSMIPDESINFVFSWDSFVHMHKNVVESYLVELNRVLKVGGHAFIHHANFHSGQKYSFLNLGGRANLTQEEVIEMCEKNNLEVLNQTDVSFGLSVNDIVSIIKKKSFDIKDVIVPAKYMDFSKSRQKFYNYVIPKLIAKNKPIYILETGTMHTDNQGAFTLVMGYLIKNLTGGKLYTVDISKENLDKCRDFTKEYSDVIEYIHSDSVEYLKNISEKIDYDLIYLDSFDLNVTDPHPSSEHHLNELKEIYDYLKKDTIIAVDDNYEPGTIIYWDWDDGSIEEVETGDSYIGKGAYIDPFLYHRGWKRHDEFDEQSQNNIYCYERLKIGIQMLAYNCESTFEKLIEPWVRLGDKYDIKIWVASGQFKIYHDMGYENLNGPTIELLDVLLNKGWIDYLFQPDPDNLLGDHTTRDKCIPWMRENDVDLMIQLDADEFYSFKEVESYMDFIMNNQEYDTYDTIFNNLLGDGDNYDWSRFSAGWIKRHGGISHYYHDAHFSFIGKSQYGIQSDELNIEYRNVNNIAVPKELVHPDHFTWTNKDNTTGPSHIKDKIEYQKKYYSDGCGYSWDNEKNKLVLNKEYEVARDYDHITELYESKKKIIYVAPHLSTGGSPEWLRKVIESIKDIFDVYVVEFNCFSNEYTIQREKIIEMIGEDKFYSLGWVDTSGNTDKKIYTKERWELINIIDEIQPDIVHINEIPEAFEYTGFPDEILFELYKRDNRCYNIYETSHTSTFNPDKNKRCIPDAFIHCSSVLLEQYKNFDIPQYVIELPIEKRERPDRDEKLRSMELNPSFLHVLHVGLFNENKNQKFIFDLAEELQNEKIMFHFIGNHCYLDNCGITDTQLNLPNCKVYGERGDVDDFMSCTDVYLFPSKKELNPLTVKEALSWGMEVVVNRDEYVIPYLNKSNFYILDEINIKEFLMGLITDYSHLIKKTSPLLIPLNRFKSFDDYFSSLSNSARSSFTATKQKETLSKIEYFKDNFNYLIIKDFMEMWSNQKIHEGYPLWGEWTIDFLKEMNNKNLLHCFYAKSKETGEIISLHFVFKWDDYVYCNSPLYDKVKYDEISLGKTMWYQLIRYSIENNFCNYLDLDGNDSGDTYKEVIDNKNNTASPGDQGYKWLFIPKDIKVGKKMDELYFMSTYVDSDRKGIKKDKKLMIVAHPDDETIFGFSELDLDNNWKVVSVSDHLRPDEVSGMVEFKQAMKFYGIIDYEMWDFEASLNIHFPSEELGDRVGKLINSDNWSKIVTHNPIGEYGNIQHKDVFDSVRKNTDEFYVFCKTTKRIDDDVWNRKQKVLDIYNKTQDSYFKSDNLEFQYWFIFPDNTTSYQEHGTISLYDKNKDTTKFISCVDKYENYKFNGDRSSYWPSTALCAAKHPYIPNPGGMSYDSIGQKDFKDLYNTLSDREFFNYYDINEGDVVVDLGAGIGLVTLRVLEKNPSKVYSVEASDLIYQDLCKNVESYDNVIPYKLLIGEEKNKNGIYKYSGEEVDILSFYEFVKQNKINKIDFLMTDIEGAEYEIFNDDDSSNWIKDNVKNIAGTVHIYSGTDDRRKEFLPLIDKIKELGFDLFFHSFDGLDITEQLINNHWLMDKDQNAIDYYTEAWWFASKKVVVNNLIEEPMVMENAI